MGAGYHLANDLLNEQHKLGAHFGQKPPLLKTVQTITACMASPNQAPPLPQEIELLAKRVVAEPNIENDMQMRDALKPIFDERASALKIEDRALMQKNYVGTDGSGA